MYLTPCHKFLPIHSLAAEAKASDGSESTPSLTSILFNICLLPSWLGALLAKLSPLAHLLLDICSLL